MSKSIHNFVLPWWYVGVAAFALLMIGLAAGVRLFTSPAHRPWVSITIGGIRISAEVAATPETRARGLSGRAQLPEGTGMLFIFDAPERPAFWMQGMNFPLDLIWITGDRVLEITPNVPAPVAGQELPRYLPANPVNAVLEVPAGFCQRHGIQVGDPVQW